MVNEYLISVGFSEIKYQKQLNSIIDYILKNNGNNKNKKILKLEEKLSIIDINQDFANNIGLKVVGELDDSGIFNLEYCYPYLNNNDISLNNILEVEKFSDKNAYVGICEDNRVGISLIFYIQNMPDYIKNVLENNEAESKSYDVALSGLAKKGKILFPIYKDKVQEKKQAQDKYIRSILLSAARMGDMEAVESITLDDMDIYTINSKRVQYEDIMSIVDTHIIPFGVESDKYSVLGNILKVEKMNNVYTDEEIYIMVIECNSIKMNICINSIDLLGKPEVGRRFKGDIWLQGKIIL